MLGAPELALCGRWSICRTFAAAVLAAAVAGACSSESSAPSDDEDGGGGSGNAATGGSSMGGDASETGGSSAGGTTSGAGGTSNGGAATGGTEAGGSGGGGDAGATTTGGSSGAPNGGSGEIGGSGTSGSGGLGGTPSTGCSSAQVPMNGRFTIDVAGTEREYILKLPADYDVTMPLHRRLIFAFHGARYSAQTVADGGPPGSGPYYGIEAASGESAIFVATQALSSGWSNAGDVAYVNAMVTRLKTELCVDESRIFATGFSAGAIMTTTLGCTGDATFRAIAPMSGSLPSPCDGTRPLAYWSSHATEDMTIRIPQGEASRNEFIEKNGCSMTTVPGDRAGCVNYEGCDAGAPVTWCTFSGAHEPAPYAGEAIWAFFSQF